MSASVLPFPARRSPDDEPTAPGSSPGRFAEVCSEMHSLDESAAAASRFEIGELQRARRLLALAFVLLAIACALGAAWLA